jgi:hypothetical protein
VEAVAEAQPLRFRRPSSLQSTCTASVCPDSASPLSLRGLLLLSRQPRVQDVAGAQSRRPEGARTLVLMLDLVLATALQLLLGVVTRGAAQQQLDVPDPSHHSADRLT